MLALSINPEWPIARMPVPESRLPEYAPLVRKLALQLIARLPASVDLDDLIQAGLMGLLDAMRRYEESATAQFETYATARIRGAMLDELRSQDWLPRSVRSKAKKIDQAIGRLEQQFLRAPTETEIASEMGVGLDEYQDLLHDAQGVQIMHYEDFGNEHDESNSAQWLPQEGDTDTGIHGADPMARALTNDLRQHVIAAIDALPDREKLLLSLCFEQGLNLKEIGAVLDVTEARVCQLRSQATARIRSYLAERDWKGLPADMDLAQII